VSLGIVCGLKSERAALGQAGRDAFISGASADRAEEGARALVREGACALLSIGLAGALDPDLVPGTLLLPSSVHGPKGERYPGTPLIDGGQGYNTAPLFGSDDLIATAEEKKALRQTGAASVDMESHRVGKVALENGLPFHVVRAIADPAGQALPPAARGAVRPDGSVATARTIIALLRRPQDLPSLMRLGAQASRGLESLRGPGVALLGALQKQYRND
jgi:adenosylhomocysteine nucleosidase